ncbi:MAG TPA: hypothetical protein QF624_08805 [Dehalococcoidia bacterium]|nr:hypothetical protein [Dehalococcoidia bacterium]
MLGAAPLVEPRNLNVFFDVDNTLIMWNGKLRNHVRDVFERLRDGGHTIYVWSGVGIRRWDMKRHELDDFVEEYYIKPLDRHHERLETLGVPMRPDFVIDDHRQVVDAFGGYHVSDMPGADDAELLDALAAIEEHAASADDWPASLPLLG